MTRAWLSRAGIGALHRLALPRSLLAFDLDGTLAPLVARPCDARVRPYTVRQLQLLARRWPLAVITGRQVADARRLLGFAPRYLVGNHGAEPAGQAVSPARRARLDACRTLLLAEAMALRESGIELEDKGLSLALHYARAAAPDAARRLLDRLLAPLSAGVHCCHGHGVLNVVPTGAPDKGDALRLIVRDCGAVRALVVGDDTNDEAAFAAAPPGSVCVRIGAHPTPTRARFRIADQRHVERLLGLLGRLRR